MKREAFQSGLICVVFVILILAGCATDKYSVRRKAPNADQYQYALHITYLDEEMLIERFSEKNNPFLSPHALTKGNQITAFDLVIENNSPESMTIQMIIETITLYSGTSTFHARNQFKLNQFWDNQLRGTHARKKYRGSTASKMRYVIGKNMFENITAIESGEQKRSILVFQGNIQKWGDVEVHIPLFTDKQEFIGEYVETYAFE